MTSSIKDAFASLQLFHVPLSLLWTSGRHTLKAAREREDVGVGIDSITPRTVDRELRDFHRGGNMAPFRYIWRRPVLVVMTTTCVLHSCCRLQRDVNNRSCHGL
ncbi:hypothetical protein CHARACLAT_002597 [Characodon lateralis]|uniref:Secreted protein n=1 Tax=Characodon lateralis TaxID=208331 RepID=A0ABU7DFC9_9TELE|nr:hypothetical protein [Characodon lateralis]